MNCLLSLRVSYKTSHATLPPPMSGTVHYITVTLEFCNVSVNVNLPNNLHFWIAAQAVAVDVVIMDHAKT